MFRYLWHVFNYIFASSIILVLDFISIFYGYSTSLCRFSSLITLFWSSIPKLFWALTYLVISLDIVILFVLLFYAFMGVFYMMPFNGSLVLNPLILNHFHFLVSFTLFLIVILCLQFICIFSSIKFPLLPKTNSKRIFFFIVPAHFYVKQPPNSLLFMFFLFRWKLEQLLRVSYEQFVKKVFCWSLLQFLKWR